MTAFFDGVGTGDNSGVWNEAPKPPPVARTVPARPPVRKKPEHGSTAPDIDAAKPQTKTTGKDGAGKKDTGKVAASRRSVA